jgi:hypothetical protein
MRSIYKPGPYIPCATFDGTGAPLPANVVDNGMLFNPGSIEDAIDVTVYVAMLLPSRA